MSKEIIGAAIEVHRHLGAGLLESAYEECLCKELEIRDIAFERQKLLPVVYKGITLDCGYKLDVVVEGKVILELKFVNKFESIHDAQLLTSLKLCALCCFAVSYFCYRYLFLMGFRTKSMHMM